MINPFKKFVIFLCRKNVTIKKLHKMSKYSLFVYIFLLITIGLNWKISFSNPHISVSVGMNLKIWWSLIMLQNFSTLFIFFFQKKLDKYTKSYINLLLKDKSVVVAYIDDTFKLGATYKIEDDNNNLAGLPWNIGRYGYLPKEGIFNGYYAGLQPINREKVFKFVSSQKNRKLKLQKLANLS